jgi:hypothetical protein
LPEPEVNCAKKDGKLVSLVRVPFLTAAVGSNAKPLKFLDKFG